MEIGLGVFTNWDNGYHVRVLILVVVEIGLGVKIINQLKLKKVLILVVVEIGLGVIRIYRSS